jgi:hypothetical protein
MSGDNGFASASGVSQLPENGSLPTMTSYQFWPGIPDWAGAKFEFDFTPVPEASAFGAAGVGLLGLVYIGRFAFLRRKMKLA